MMFAFMWGWRYYIQYSCIQQFNYNVKCNEVTKDGYICFRWISVLENPRQIKLKVHIYFSSKIYRVVCVVLYIRTKLVDLYREILMMIFSTCVLGTYTFNIVYISVCWNTKIYTQIIVQVKAKVKQSM